MSISTFLNSIDETVNDVNEDILDSIISSYVECNRTQETNKELIKVVPIRQQETMQTVRLLQHYEEQQNDGDSDILRQLVQFESTIKDRISNNLRQAQITSYFR